MRWGIGEAAFGSGETNAAPPPYTETVRLRVPHRKRVYVRQHQVPRAVGAELGYCASNPPDQRFDTAP